MINFVIGYAVGQVVAILVVYFGHRWYSFKRDKEKIVFLTGVKNPWGEGGKEWVYPLGSKGKEND
jgi:hypothetical protein